MEFTEEIWLKIGYILRSKRKTKILRLLKENTKTVTEISTELNIGGGSVYTLINELVDIDVVACVDEEQKGTRDTLLHHLERISLHHLTIEIYEGLKWIKTL